MLSNYSTPLAVPLVEASGDYVLTRQASTASSLMHQPYEDASEGVMAALLNRFSAADFDPESVAFPEGTDGVYTDLVIAEHRLRVYAMVHSAQAQRSLFLILGSIKDSYLPMGSRLTVSEKNLLLSVPGLHWSERSTYIYTQVFGDWEEKFTIEIELPNAHPKLLAPLTLKDARSLSPLLTPSLTP